MVLYNPNTYATLSHNSLNCCLINKSSTSRLNLVWVTNVLQQEHDRQAKQAEMYVKPHRDCAMRPLCFNSTTGISQGK